MQFGSYAYKRPFFPKIFFFSIQERLAAGEVERTDSGVGSETSKPSLAIRRGYRGHGGIASAKEGDVPLCNDCDAPVDTRVTNR